MRQVTKSGPCYCHQAICSGPTQGASQLDWILCWRQGLISNLTSKRIVPQSLAHSLSLVCLPSLPPQDMFVSMNVMPLNPLASL